MKSSWCSEIYSLISKKITRGSNMWSKKSPASLGSNSSEQLSNSGGFEIGDLQLTEIPRLLWRGKTIIIATTLLGLLLATFYLLAVDKIYTATATVRIDTYQPVLPDSSHEISLREQTVQKSYLATEISMITSRSVARAALNDPATYEAIKKSGMIELPNEKNGEKPTELSALALDQYLEHLRVIPVEETSLTQVSASTTSPDLSALIANNHVKRYIEYSYNLWNQGGLVNVNSLETQAELMHKRLQEAEKKLVSFAKRHSLLISKRDESSIEERTEKVNALLDQASTERIYLESKVEEAKKANWENAPFIHSNSISKLVYELSKAETEHNELQEKYSPNFRTMVELRSKIVALKQEIKKLRLNSFESLKAELSASIATENALKKKLDDLKNEVLKRGKVQVEYSTMKREYESTKDLRQSIILQLQEHKLSTGAQARNISIASEAYVPYKHAWPNSSLIICVVTTFGFVFGVLLVIFLSQFTNFSKEEFVECEEITNLKAV
jgi:polysaccharide biosynthesis transport protein